MILKVIHSRNQPRTQVSLLQLISQEDPGKKVARGSAIDILLGKVSMHVSPAEEAHVPPLSFAADIIIPLSSSSSPRNMINTTGSHVNRSSTSSRESASQGPSQDSSYISLEKGAKAASKFGDGSGQIKVELQCFFPEKFRCN